MGRDVHKVTRAPERDVPFPAFVFLTLRPRDLKVRPEVGLQNLAVLAPRFRLRDLGDLVQTI